jgi:hypothetical protein
MIPEEEWDEYLKLKTLMDTGRETFEYSAQKVAQLVIYYGATSLEENVVKQLVYAVSNPLFPDPETLEYCPSLAMYFLCSALIESAV